MVRSKMSPFNVGNIVIYISLTIINVQGFYVNNGDENYPRNQEQIEQGSAFCKSEGVVCPEEDPPGDATYYAISNISQFCECSNGIPYLFDCPSGQIFNPNVNVCVSPEIEYNLLLEQILADVYGPDKEELEAGTAVCIAQGVVCPEEDPPGEATYYEISDKHRFCQCSNGLPYLFDCPKHQIFNATLNVCVDPETEYNLLLEQTLADAYGPDKEELEAGTAVCIAQGVVCPEEDPPGEATYYEISDKHRFCQCSNGLPYLFDCPKHQIFNATLNVCVDPETEYNLLLEQTLSDAYGPDKEELEAGTTVCIAQGVVCPEEDPPGEAAYYEISDKHRFCQCSNGLPYLFDCPKHQIFNATLNVCGEPESEEYNLLLEQTLADAYGPDKEELEAGTAVCIAQGVVCPEEDPPGEATYYEISDKHRFCQCSNGLPYLFDCPKHQIFNATLNVCGEPESEEYNLLLEQTLADAYGPDKEELEAGTAVCIAQGVVCPEEDPPGEATYYEISDKHRFCQCSNGLPYLFDCPKHQIFNATLNVCVDPETEYNLLLEQTLSDAYGPDKEELEAGTTVCIAQGVVCPEEDPPGEAAYYEISDKHRFCQCSNGLPYLFDCPKHQIFNATLNVCGEPESEEYNLLLEQTLADAYGPDKEELEAGTAVCIAQGVVCPEEDPPGEATYYEISDKHRFCQCSNGLPYLFDCPKHQIFNATLNVCVDPETEYNLLLEQTLSDAYGPDKEELEAGTTVCIAQGVVCPEEDPPGEATYYEISDKHRFCQCSNGLPYLFDCPKHQIFNATLNVCVDPETEYNLLLEQTLSDAYGPDKEELEAGTAVCIAQGVVCPEEDPPGEATYYEISDKHRFCQCSNGLPYLFDCPKHQIFNATLNVCVDPETEYNLLLEQTLSDAYGPDKEELEAGTTVCIAQGVVCPEEDPPGEATYYEISDKHRFCQCSNGLPYLFDCPKHQIFNATLNVCVDPETEYNLLLEQTLSDAYGPDKEELEAGTAVCIAQGVVCPEEDLPGEATYYEISDKHRFCQCSNGLPYLFDCPKHQIFNATLNVCVDPETEYNLLLEQTLSDAYGPDKEELEAGTAVCIAQGVVCPEEDPPGEATYYEISDKHRFCQCSNGLPYLFDCPKHQIFNATLNVCGEPESGEYNLLLEQTLADTYGPDKEELEAGTAVCIAQGVVCPEEDPPGEATYYEISDKHRFCQCSNGLPYLFDCPKHQIFNATLNVCGEPESEEYNLLLEQMLADAYGPDKEELEAGTAVCIGQGVVCPEEDPPGEASYYEISDKHRFCQCSNGLPYLFDCPNHQIFNATLNVCVDPETEY